MIENEKERMIETDFDFPKVVTIADLCYRWEMSRQGIHRKINVECDFPKPVQFVSNGKIALFFETDILIYEEKKPWVDDPLYRDARQELIWKNVVSKK